MAFDLSKVMKDAEESVKKEESSGNGGGFQFPLVYPQQGKLSFQLFFNPKSNSAMRTIIRHRIDGKQIPCFRSYGQDCPICKALDDVKNSVGTDLWSKYGYKVRAVMYGQYIESTYAIEANNSQLPPKSTILLMVPKTVFSDINSALVNAGNNLQQIVASNESLIFNIERDQKNSYSTQLDPFKKNKAFNSEEEFEKYINNLPDLNNSMIKASIDDDMRMNSESVAREIKSKYMTNINASNPNSYVSQQQAPQQQQNPFGNQQQPQQAPAQQPQQNPFGNQQQAPQPQPQSQQVPQSQPQQQQNPFGNQQQAPQPQPQQNPFANTQPAPQQQSQPNPFEQQAPQQAPQQTPQSATPGQGNPSEQSNPVPQKGNPAPQGNPFANQTTADNEQANPFGNSQNPFG